MFPNPFFLQKLKSLLSYSKHLVSYLLCCLLMHYGFSQGTSRGMDTKKQKAYELAWSSSYEDAISLFREILKEDPKSLDARLGLSYTYAWKKAYSQALRNFRLVLVQDPENPEAIKGIAYTNLWSGQYQRSLATFERLPPAMRASDEIIQARGFIYVHLQKLSLARKEYDAISSPKPKEELGLAIQAAQAKWEAHIWGGLSRISEINTFGIRAAQLIWAPKNEQRLWIRMDNSLTMDNRSLILRDTAATAYWAGGSWKLGPKWQSQVEIGQRRLSFNKLQRIIQVEQVFFYHPGQSLKVGSFLGFGERLSQDFLFYAGLSQELSSQFWTEQTVYTAWTGSRFDQYRVAISLKHRVPAGYEFILGVQGGEQFIDEDTFDTSVWGIWGQIQAPVFKRHWLFLTARQEKTPLFNFMNIALGARLRLE